MISCTNSMHKNVLEIHIGFFVSIVFLFFLHCITIVSLSGNRARLDLYIRLDCKKFDLLVTCRTSTPTLDRCGVPVVESWLVLKQMALCQKLSFNLFL